MERRLVQFKQKAKCSTEVNFDVQGGGRKERALVPEDIDTQTDRQRSAGEGE